MVNNDDVTSQTSSITGVPEDVVDVIMRWEKKHVLEATNHHSSVEVTGMGHFSVRDGALAKRVKRLGYIMDGLKKKQELLEPEDPKWTSLQYRMNKIVKELEYLATK